MKALILEEIGKLALREVPEPEPGQGETLVAVTRCALCRTDAKMWLRGQRDLVLPRVLGHEICGVRESDGQRVAVWPAESCGKCSHCTAGSENLCGNIRVLGFNKDGGFAEKVMVGESSLLSLPSALGDDLACLAEPLACAINALEQSETPRGANILIFGAGSLGLLLALAAIDLGAIPTIVEINRDKLHRSRMFRIGLGIAAVESPGSGLYDIAINACPASETFHQGVSRLKPGGIFCMFSGFNQDENFPSCWINEIHYRQLRVVGAYGCARSHFTKAVNLLDRSQDEVRLLIDKEIDLESAPEGLQEILAGQALKIEVVFR
jgi:threonine dehydrogenase-like Zn-dependent dehydrogenase